MSLDVDGFTNEIEGGDVLITVDSNHKLLKLARQLPWDDMLEAIRQCLDSISDSLRAISRVRYVQKLVRCQKYQQIMQK